MVNYKIVLVLSRKPDKRTEQLELLEKDIFCNRDIQYEIEETEKNFYIKTTTTEDNFERLADVFNIPKPITFNHKVYLLSKLLRCEILKEKHYVKDYFVYSFINFKKKLSDSYEESKYSFLKFPIEEFRHVHGEEHTYYFDFVQHVTKWLCFIMLFGLIGFVYQQVTDTVDNWYGVIYTFIITIWSSVWLKYWDRNVVVRNYQWELKNISIVEPNRTQFVGEPIEKKYLGKTISYYPRRERVLKFVFACIPIMLLFVGAVVLNVYLNIWMQSNYESLEGFDRLFNQGISSVIYTSIMIGLDLIFDKISLRLTEWENHQYWSAHRNSLIMKQNVFMFFNTFFGLFYKICFLQTYNIDRLYRDLLTQYALKEIVYRHAKDTIVRVGTKCIHNIMGKVRLTTPESSSLDKEYSKNELDIKFLIDNYQTIIILYTYATMFACFFPLAPVLFFINNWYEVNVDYKDYEKYRISIPHEVNDIGIWRDILRVVSYVSITINALLILFYSKIFPEDLDLLTKIFIVVIYERFLIVVRYLVNFLKADRPSMLRALLKHELESKHEDMEKEIFDSVRI